MLAVCGATTTPLLTTGCFTNNCYHEYRELLSSGHMIDANTWESATVDSDNWLPFEGRVQYGFYLPLDGRVPYDVTVHLSTSANPQENGSLVAAGTGNAAILRFAPNYISVYNDTCATYYLHVVVHAAPLPPADAGDGGDLAGDGGDLIDAGADDAGADDAGADADIDADGGG